MRSNHSPLQFFGLSPTASVLASGDYAPASPVLAGSSCASQTGTPSRVDGTRTVVNSDRTSRATRSVTTAATSTGGLVSPTSGPPASGSATPGQHLAQVTTPEAPAKPPSPTPAKPSTRVDIRVTPLVGGGNSAAASTGATFPPGTTTTTASTGPSLAESPAGTPVLARLSARPAPASQPQATPPAVAALPSETRAATQLSVTRPPATQPVATPPSVTSPVATAPVATAPVATAPVATQSLEPGLRRQ
jgi:hypothetical protein